MHVSSLQDYYPSAQNPLPPSTTIFMLIFISRVDAHSIACFFITSGRVFKTQYEFRSKEIKERNSYGNIIDTAS